MTNCTDGTWEDLNEGRYQKVLGYIRWLILITFIIIRWADKLSDFLNNKCLEFLKRIFQIILDIIHCLNNCCALITDDVDENFPSTTFRENPKPNKDTKI